METHFPAGGRRALAGVGAEGHAGAAVWCGRPHAERRLGGDKVRVPMLTGGAEVERGCKQRRRRCGDGARMPRERLQQRHPQQRDEVAAAAGGAEL